MLTKNDLKEIQKIVKDEVDYRLMKETQELKRTIARTVRDEIDPLKKEFKELAVNVRILKKDVKSIKKNINELISRFDDDHMLLRKRIEKIERHINLPSS